jgi:Arc/MetJ-type ribon-helix-helix transcriptional regulator
MDTMRNKMNNTLVAARISSSENQAIMKLVENGQFLNKADFVRMAIRNELSQRKELEKNG